MQSFFLKELHESLTIPRSREHDPLQMIHSDYDLSSSNAPLLIPLSDVESEYPRIYNISTHPVWVSAIVQRIRSQAKQGWSSAIHPALVTRTHVSDFLKRMQVPEEEEEEDKTPSSEIKCSLQTCNKVLARGRRLFCGKCFQATYCDHECQEQHWKVAHHDECRQWHSHRLASPDTTCLVRAIRSRDKSLVRWTVKHRLWPSLIQSMQYKSTCREQIEQQESQDSSIDLFLDWWLALQQCLKWLCHNHRCKDTPCTCDPCQLELLEAVLFQMPTLALRWAYLPLSEQEQKHQRLLCWQPLEYAIQHRCCARVWKILALALETATFWNTRFAGLPQVTARLSQPARLAIHQIELFGRETTELRLFEQHHKLEEHDLVQLMQRSGASDDLITRWVHILGLIAQWRAIRFLKLKLVVAGCAVPLQFWVFKAEHSILHQHLLPVPLRSQLFDAFCHGLGWRSSPATGTESYSISLVTHSGQPQLSLPSVANIRDSCTTFVTDWNSIMPLVHNWARDVHAATDSNGVTVPWRGPSRLVPSLASWKLFLDSLHFTELPVSTRNGFTCSSLWHDERKHSWLRSTREFIWHTAAFFCHHTNVPDVHVSVHRACRPLQLFLGRAESDSSVASDMDNPNIDAWALQCFVLHAFPYLPPQHHDQDSFGARLLKQLQSRLQTMRDALSHGCGLSVTVVHALVADYMMGDCKHGVSALDLVREALDPRLIHDLAPSLAKEDEWHMAPVSLSNCAEHNALYQLAMERARADSAADATVAAIETDGDDVKSHSEAKEDGMESAEAEQFESQVLPPFKSWHAAVWNVRLAAQCVFSTPSIG